MKRKEYSWESLGNIAEIYHNMYRGLRNIYKWSPDIVDKLSIRRLLKIYNECVEDNPKKSGEIDLSEFE